MALRRGFKAEANEIALEVRSELGLRPTDRIDTWSLARHLDIPVHPLSELGDHAAWAVQHFSAVHPGVFSAVTVFDGPRREIFHNDTHTPGRQASNLAHELAHGLLLHPPTPALDNRGCRDWDQEIEDEATWLGGVLLIPELAALSIVRRGLTSAQAAAMYGVSEQMIVYRLNMTGARRRVGTTRRTGHQ